MSIEAINEQLLRAIGVGVALIDLERQTFHFKNDTFIEWFGRSEIDGGLSEIFPTLDITESASSLKDTGRYNTEISFKLGRRRMTVALEFNRAENSDENLTVLVCQNITRIKELESMIDSYSMMVERNTQEIKREKEQVEKLLLNMMPRAAYEEYKTFGVVSPRLFEEISVLALDFVDFDAMLEKHDASVIVSELNDIYGAFDRIGEQFGCERIRTNGDSYVAVSGVPDPVADNAKAVANGAIRFLRYLESRNDSHPIKWEARIGLASGSVIGSVVGVQKYIYDIFGPVVSEAMSLREYTDPMTISTNAQMVDQIGAGFDAEQFEATGKGGQPLPIVRLTGST